MDNEDKAPTLSRDISGNFRTTAFVIYYEKDNYSYADFN